MARKPLKFESNPLFAGPTLEARTRSGSPYRELSLSSIDVDPNQPRRSFTDESLRELASSIEKYGVLCPILVRPGDGGTFHLVAGERRYRASKLLKRETIPAVIDTSEGDHHDILSKQLVENLQREDLPALERADAIVRLREQSGMSVRDLAAQLGVSKSYVQRSLDIMELPDDLKAALASGASESKVLILAQVTNPATRRKLIGQLEELTREQLEGMTGAGGKREKVSHGGTAAARGAVPATDRRVAEELRKTLGLKVEIQRRKGKKDQGRVVVDFYSDDDLHEIYRRLIRS
ncbi:MAG: ParB/RepB/Spo0J family partition protein [Deltaproteobacteria bacterium]|nr:ParB/RepB/Spo0J family partition protein [Deltaproteobacteria bacterium]